MQRLGLGFEIIVFVSYYILTVFTRKRYFTLQLFWEMVFTVLELMYRIGCARLNKSGCGVLSSVLCYNVVLFICSHMFAGEMMW